MTSALKAFNLAAEDAIKVVDKLTKVDQIAAVSAGGISEALSKSATSAKLAGMSMDELIGSVSVIGEITQQSMDTVGNAMKSILARYGNVKASVFTQMGLDDDGETADNINDIEKVLSKLGIRIRSSAGELRSITDVLDDVNAKWETYDTVTKNAIATSFGGTRMRENFLVLIENWDRVKELTQESANAAGTADEKYSAYMESIDAATKRVQASWEGFTQKLETSGVIKKFADFMSFLVDHLDSILRILTAIATLKFNSVITNFISNSIQGGKSKIAGLFENLRGIKSAPIRSQEITTDEKGNITLGQIESGKGKTNVLINAINNAANSIGNDINSGNLTKIQEEQLSVLKESLSLQKGGAFTSKNSSPKTFIDGNISYGDYKAFRTRTGSKDFNKKEKEEAHRQLIEANAHLELLMFRDSKDEYYEKAKQRVEDARAAYIEASNKGEAQRAQESYQIRAFENQQKLSGVSQTATWSGFGLGRAGKIFKTSADAQFAYDKDRGGYFYIDSETGKPGELGVDTKLSQQADKVIKVQAKQVGASAAISGVIAGIVMGTQRSVAGGSTLGGKIAKGFLGATKKDIGDQEVESQAASVSKGIVGGLGTALSQLPMPWGLIGTAVTTLGPIVIDGISTLVHSDELAMKQRVTIAKENLNKLNDLQSTMESNGSIMTEELTSSEDFEKLYKYTDDLYDKLFELQYDGNVDIKGAINNAYGTFKGVGNITSIRDLCDEINNGNADQRSMIKRQLELAEAQVNLEQLQVSQEENYAEANKVLEGDIEGEGFWSALWKNFLGNDAVSVDQKKEKFFSNLGFITNTRIGDRSLLGSLSFANKNLSAEEKYEKVKDLLDQVKKSDLFTNEEKSVMSDYIEKYLKNVDKTFSELSKLNKQLISARSNIGFLAADIHDLTTTELKDLTMDGVIGRVVEALEAQGVEVRNAAGYIKDEYQDAIEKLIKSDSKFNALQQADTKTLGQLTSAQERFSSMLEKQTELVKEYGESWEKWYDAAKRGKLSEEIAKIVYAANPERIEQFARAWNATREGLEKLTKEFPDLTTAIGLMSPSEVREYYSVFTDLFEDLAADSALTAENFEKLINQYPQLLKYYKNGTLSTELLSKANDEQKIAYANAMLSAELSNTEIGEDFLAAVKSVSMGKANEEAARFTNLTEESAATILEEIGSVKSLNEVLDKANALRQKGDEDAALALEGLVKQYLNYEKVIEWTDPIYAMAQQGEIDRLTQEIENLNEQKDALSNVNDERQRELDLIKAKEALENARKEKKRVFRSGLGFVMESDEEAITTAQENLDKLNVEKQQEDIQYQIEQLESLKSILENLDEEKQKEANKKALEEYFGENMSNLANSGLVTKLVEGYAENRITINTGTGEIKDAEGNVIGTIDGLEGVKASKAKQTETAKTALIGGKDAKGNDITGAFEDFNKAKEDFEKISKESDKIGTKEYREFAMKYTESKNRLEEKLTAAKNAGVDEETINEGSELLKGYKEPEKADWIFAGTIENPDKSLLGNHVVSGSHGIMLTTKEVADADQFSKSKYTVVKRYDSSTGEWGGWEKIDGSISGLPDNSIVMNSDWDDAYAWVKNGQLYWVADKDGNIKKDGTWDNDWATGTLSAPEGVSLINELGTEAVITPGGTLTALPSKTGIVPADITRNVWALGEVAPTLVAQLGSLTQKTLSGNAGNTTYEEGQYFDNFTMNVYPAKGDDFNKILEQARAQMRLTRHNN